LRREGCFTLSNILAENLPDYDGFLHGDLVAFVLERLGTDEIDVIMPLEY
jgi:hypothetical protein